LQQAFDALRRRLGVARAVRLMHSALVQAPTVIGWLRPVVLIPASCLTGLSTMQIEAILAHELAHIRRHDYLVSVLQSVVETLLFYHPRCGGSPGRCGASASAAATRWRLRWAATGWRTRGRCRCWKSGGLLARSLRWGRMEECLKMRIKRLLGCKEDSAVSQFAAFTVLALIVAAGWIVCGDGGAGGVQRGEPCGARGVAHSD
jgi:hypothetical protein